MKKLVSTRRSKGFSLVELLVVIAIISLLVSLLVVGAFVAMTRARTAQIKMEIAGLTRALEAYKQEYGSYPPDFSEPFNDPQSSVSRELRINEQIRSHLSRSFRYRHAPPTGTGTTDRLPDTILENLDPKEAIYFWLRGFTANAKFPLTGGVAPGVEVERKTLFEFDERRLIDTDGDNLLEYVPANGKDRPYLMYGNYERVILWAAEQGNTVPAPYVKDHQENEEDHSGEHFVGEDKFQIISAGLDGQYGWGIGHYPSGIGYTPEHRDNITSFSQGTTLEDDIP